MPLQGFRYQFAHDFRLRSFFVDFLDARVCFGPTKPVESRPSLKRMLNRSRAVGRGDRTLSESQLDGARDRLSAPQRAEERELFGLNAAKIDGEVHAMDRQKDLSGLELRNGTDPAMFSTFLNSVTCPVRCVISVFHFQKQVVDRIVQLK